MLSEQTWSYGLGSRDDSSSGWGSRLQIGTRELSALDGIQGRSRDGLTKSTSVDGREQRSSTSLGAREVGQ